MRENQAIPEVLTGMAARQGRAAAMRARRSFAVSSDEESHSSDGEPSAGMRGRPARRARARRVLSNGRTHVAQVAAPQDGESEDDESQDDDYVPPATGDGDEEIVVIRGGARRGDDDSDDDDDDEDDAEDDEDDDGQQNGLTRRRGQTGAGPQRRRGQNKRIKKDLDPQALLVQEIMARGKTPPHSSDEDESVLPETMRAAIAGARHNLYGGFTRRAEQLAVYHPELSGLWERLAAIPLFQARPQDLVQPDGLALQLLPFQLEGVAWLRAQEAGPFKGGILADEMGMGKTIQTISLLLSEPGEGPTLVIAPTVALVQWKSEIDRYTNGRLRVLTFYGPAIKAMTAQTLAEHDVVLTTYAVVESVFRRQNKGLRKSDGKFVKAGSLLHSTNFYRIVLDEAHNIKDRACATTRSVLALKSERKLCLSGTPLQNRIGEIFSLLRFLRADPFAYYMCRNCSCRSLTWNFSVRSVCECGHRSMSHICYFNQEILRPIQRWGNLRYGRRAFSKAFLLLRHLMLRRTKEERAADLGLPPRVMTVRRDFFNEQEEDVYMSLFTASQRQFDSYLAQGVVLNNYANIFELITRMRQMANHPDLVVAHKNSKFGVREEKHVCRICDEPAEDAIASRCHHTFCRTCITEYMESSEAETPMCPVCNVTMVIDLAAPAMTDVSNADKTTPKSILNRIDMSRWKSSTKIEALAEELFKLRYEDKTIKSIVFSQFTSMLDLIGWRLRRAGFNCVKLDGSMTPEARAATINVFNTRPEITVFLVSLKAGGVALNLTEASQVFLVDPWWNPAFEWQAADRVHRLGQRRPIRITRLVIENSIESKIIELQAKKADMINATIDSDAAALNRLSTADLRFLFTN